MSTALFSGLSGLRANQEYLDVIGNNLANSNTPGYKASRVTFSDVLSQTLRPATGATGQYGGTDPLQLGGGTQVASIDQNFGQGSLLATGRTLDLGLQGNGFFVVNSGSQQFYSRVGAFKIDNNQFLTDSRSGLHVQGADGNDIQIDLNGVVAPSATSVINFHGNLPGRVTGPLTETQQSTAPYKDAQPAVVTGAALPGTLNLAGSPTLQLQFDSASPQTITFPPTSFVNPVAATPAEVLAVLNSPTLGLHGATASLGAGNAIVITSDTTGTAAKTTIVGGTAVATLGLTNGVTSGSESVAVASTPLNSLKGNTKDYVVGDTIRLRGSRPDGTSVDVTFNYGTDGTTLGALITKASTAFTPDATLTLNADGTLELKAAAAGASQLNLSFSDGIATGQTGRTNFALEGFDHLVRGSGPDTQTTVLSVHDSLGIVHQVSVKFERQTDGKWAVTASVPAADGTVTTGTAAQLQFSTDGSLPTVPTTTLDITWANSAAPSSINLAFGTPGLFDGLTQTGEAADVGGSSDGAPAGSLSTLSVTQDGTIQGVYTNGQTKPLAQLQIAQFTNPAGLERTGSGLFKASSNSGDAQLGAAGTGSAGTVASGSLEGSNVDVAEEFVRLIEAQRGFQASARVITTSDQVLSELVNLGR